MLQPLSVPKEILIMPNAALPKATAISSQLARRLNALGAHPEEFHYDFEKPARTPDLSGRDLLITIGGDGTLLRAGHLCAPAGVPLLGVQAGRLGFLVELSESQWPDMIDRLFQGSYHLENRMMLLAQFFQAGQLNDQWDVINEIVVCRGMDVRPIEVRVDLNEGYLTSYIADGLIVSTATGSTAYALAAGGPILPPELRNMLLLPIAPHLSLDRAVVLAEGACVALRALGEHQAVLSVDGMAPVEMTPEDYVRVTANTHSLQMVRFGEPNYFYRDLAEVLHINPVLRVENHD